VPYGTSLIIAYFFEEFEEFRSSGVQEFRSSGVQEFRSSGVQDRNEGKNARQNRLKPSGPLTSQRYVQRLLNS
jgi:hypothetical protein